MAIKKRLIYADDLDYALEKTPIRIAADKVKMFKLIEEAPAVDAEIVVRCKDCKHVDKYGDCDIFDEWSTRTPDDFCSYGERKTDG